MNRPKRQLRLDNVDFLAFKPGYVRNDARVHAVMRLVCNFFAA